MDGDLSLRIGDDGVVEVDGVKLSQVVIKDFCAKGTPAGCLCTVRRVDDHLEAKLYRSLAEAEEFFRS